MPHLAGNENLCNTATIQRTEKTRDKKKYIFEVTIINDDEPQTMIDSSDCESETNIDTEPTTVFPPENKHQWRYRKFSNEFEIEFKPWCFNSDN